MLSQFITSSPLPTDKFKNIFANLRLFKTLFRERYELDHSMSPDTGDTDCHKQLTMKRMTISNTEENQPYAWNSSGQCVIPSGGAILMVENVNNAERLVFITMKNGVKTKVYLR